MLRLCGEGCSFTSKKIYRESRIAVIDLPRDTQDTVESLVTRRQNLTRKEFKRILESEAHPCKRFLDKPVDHGHNLRSLRLTQRTSEYLYYALLGSNNGLFLKVLNLT